MATYPKNETGIVLAIDDFYIKNGCPPTLRQLCAMTGYQSTNTIWIHLKNLEKQGVIDLYYGKPVPLWVHEAIQKYQDKPPHKEA